MLGLEIPRALVVVWAALALVTAASWWLGLHAPDGGTPAAAIVLLAFVKVRFVGLWFMELRDAPTSLRWTFEAWCLVVPVTLLLLHFLGR